MHANDIYIQSPRQHNALSELESNYLMYQHYARCLIEFFFKWNIHHSCEGVGGTRLGVADWWELYKSINQLQPTFNVQRLPVYVGLDHNNTCCRKPVWCSIKLFLRIQLNAYVLYTPLCYSITTARVSRSSLISIHTYNHSTYVITCIYTHT